VTGKPELYGKGQPMSDFRDSETTSLHPGAQPGSALYSLHCQPPDLSVVDCLAVNVECFT